MDELKELRSLVNELTNKLDNVAEDSRADKEKKYLIKKSLP